MNQLSLHDVHAGRGAAFLEVNGCEVVEHYGNPRAEYAALQESAGILDLSFRGRLCLTGGDRQRFLNGQVTNEVNRLKPGQGCYAALVSAKGKMLSDLNVYLLEDEILLDFEPGLSGAIAQRLDKYIIADDVQVVEVGSLYGMLSVQGPKAAEVIDALEFGVPLPNEPMEFRAVKSLSMGEIYLMNQPRIRTKGFDLFVPLDSLEAIAGKLVAAANSRGGRACGWQALEIARIEAGVPRFGVDMDESHLPPEAGIEAQAVSYSKGCYIGQEVIARIRTYGQVAKKLRGLKLPDNLPTLPKKGDKLMVDEKEVGFVTSATTSPMLAASIAMGYVRREVNAPGTELFVQTESGRLRASVVPLPFRKEDFLK